jgi:23S rRNA (cytidine1920-2'-O)/16S rRNA (cytidine1409-2'-O)-methyltransferase
MGHTARVSRIDQSLVDRGLLPSREKAKRAVMAGQVTINGQPARKPSDLVQPTDEVRLTEPDRFVSRGGYKLEHALLHFAVEVNGLMAADLGASTGGFTDCLLQHGAKGVYAVDVGHGQLAWKLRRDPRVRVMERTNARHLSPSHFPQPFQPLDLIAADCSFISLKQVLPAAFSLVARGGRILALVKPQFEAGKAEAAKGEGVIRDPAIHQRILSDLENFVVVELGLTWQGVTESPLRGPAGNTEFLVLLEKAN